LEMVCRNVWICLEHGMAVMSNQSQEIAERVREALARRRMSRRALADAARISISTLEKALGGDRPFSLASLVRLEQVLGVELRGVVGSATQVAPLELGGYSRSAVSWLEGEYLTLRPSFETALGIHAYCMAIAWEEGLHCLRLRESGRVDSVNAQIGHVSIPPAKGKIYLSTSVAGEMRLAILNSPTRRGELFGLLLTLVSGATSLPVAAPIALVPRKPDHQFGRFAPKDEVYVQYRAILFGARQAAHMRDVSS
jgi:hypothetical protein